MTIARPTSAPHGTLILDRAHTRAALDPTQVIAAVRTALIAISRDEVSAPPRIAAHTPTGLVGAMPAWLPGTGLGAKLISVFPQPAAPGRSAHEGVVALFDDKTGRLQALINASEITAARTAATATLSMYALGPPHPHQIAVIGTGTQATAQLAMLAALDDTIPVTVAGRDPARTAHAATTHPHSTTDTIENAVRGADVIFCCTGARAPVIHRSWIRDGTHISSIGGSDGPEIDPGTIADATLFTEWTGAAHHPPPAGAHELHGLPPTKLTLLGHVLDHHHPGRRTPTETTLFKSTGHGALDIATAAIIYTTARTRGLGTHLDL